jgi:hypothetical protein
MNGVLARPKLTTMIVIRAASKVVRRHDRHLVGDGQLECINELLVERWGDGALRH